jgi:hypothetical protein
MNVSSAIDAFDLMSELEAADDDAVDVDMMMPK